MKAYMFQMIHSRARLYPAFLIFLSANVLVGFPTTLAAQIWGQHGVAVQPISTPLSIGGANHPVSSSGYSAYIDEILNDIQESSELQSNKLATFKENGHGRTHHDPPGRKKHGGVVPPTPEDEEDPVTPEVIVTPEPSTTVLLISGLTGLAFLARRRKRHSP